MGNTWRMPPARFDQILERQYPARYGKGYIPSIKSTRTEAPSGSRPAQVWFDRIGRYVHTLSTPERAVLAIITYCMHVLDVLEQRMLPYLPAEHPLSSHPLAAGLVLPRFRGTLAITDELGVLQLHPTIHRKSESARPDEPETSTEPGCWIGDLLVLLLDAAGPYCVNLSVKKSRQEFEVPQYGVTVKTNLELAARKAVARHRSEEILYREVGIPTHRIASDDLNRRVVANLQQLWLWQGRPHRLTNAQQETIHRSLGEAVDTKVSPWEVLQALELREGIRTYDAKIILYQLVRERKLRIDLYRTFFIDQPMVSETKDVLDEYGHWFKRPTQ